jgi:hypothetical protein
MLERFASPAHRLQKLLGQAHTAIPDTLRAVLDVVSCLAARQPLALRLMLASRVLQIL